MLNMARSRPYAMPAGEVDSDARRKAKHANKKCAPSGTRTHTELILSQLPLPIGLWGQRKNILIDTPK